MRTLSYVLSASNSKIYLTRKVLRLKRRLVRLSQKKNSPWRRRRNGLRKRVVVARREHFVNRVSNYPTVSIARPHRHVYGVIFGREI